MAQKFNSVDQRRLKKILDNKKRKNDDKESTDHGKKIKSINSPGLSNLKITRQERSNNLAINVECRLKFAKFRSINEYLYTHSSEDAQKYMVKERFVEYHETYSDMVSKWPVKPIDIILNKIEELFKDKDPKSLILSDIGCGKNPQIKEHFSKSTVHSFDLVSTHPDVIEADMIRIPLKHQICDCAVYCLSLMGTNIKEYIVEANRILKIGGHLLIVEVASRFEEDDIDSFAKKLLDFGFRKKYKELMPPNDYFVFFHFVKKLNRSKNNINSYPSLTLKPCQYKSR